ncbi:aprataxin [Trypanosoma conorhini]|uniref:Aprataxin n=1 Tax=Trypanosoma conorhini TaxID=83891 RepID=A0A3R7L5Z1_9TRYP|nr:aprataxin [Trypanosoma conorhini]RNF20421.1 aprataxin [Trypanosoma conorhini]
MTFLRLSGAAGRPARGAATAAAGAPRTQLPFLRKVVQDARRSPNTHQSDTPFRPYPPPGPGEERQRGSRVLYKDPQCIIVNDAYPKSRLHCVVLPLDTSLHSLNALRVEHVPLLRHFMDVADRYVQFLRKNPVGTDGASLAFATGFHALPSLPHLHMHLISLDFDSPWLKKKRHYNSFATPFFLPADKVLEDLEQNKHITLNQDVAGLKRMEEGGLRCLWCGHDEVGMPQLKAHLRTCPKSRAFSAASGAT